MEKYYNESGNLAVLISKGFGCGWSTWNDHNLAFDKRVIEYFQENGNYVPENKLQSFLSGIGYHNIYCRGWNQLQICWVPAGTKFKIREHDGNEYIEYFNENEWEIA